MIRSHCNFISSFKHTYSFLYLGLCSTYNAVTVHYSSLYLGLCSTYNAVTVHYSSLYLGLSSTYNAVTVHYSFPLRPANVLNLFISILTGTDILTSSLTSTSASLKTCSNNST